MRQGTDTRNFSRHRECSLLSFGYIEMDNHDISIEPTPRFANDSEIERAEQLRYQLEQRYFAPLGAGKNLDSANQLGGPGLGD